MNNKKYDFVLFEHLYNVENHYKDLCILAKLLKSVGYKVAIVDVFKEAELCMVDDIPHISLNLFLPIVYKKFRTFKSSQSSWISLYYRILEDFYLYQVIKRLRGIAPNIYMGSLTMATPIFFMKAFDKHTSYYMWALRSSHVLYWKMSKNKILYYYISKKLYQNIHAYKNLKLIVSNDIIKREFEEKVSMNQARLILRPERVILKRKIIKVDGKKENSLKLLFIGTLRPFKNVEFALKTLQQMDDSRISYIIAGRCKVDAQYNSLIGDLAVSVRNVTRIDRYIADEEYEQLIENCDYLLLCDKKQASCASNGTMLEALLHGKPIIAPNIDPFKSEVEKYGIGFLYEYNNMQSLSNILAMALKEGTENFTKPIGEYQKKFLFSNVANSLRKQIETEA